MIAGHRKLAEKLRFFDSNIWLGHPEGFPLAEEKSLDQLKKIATEYYLSGFLVSHWWGKTVSPQAGNEVLIQESLLLPENCFSIWTGLPFYPGSPGPLPGPDHMNRKMRGVRIFPKSHSYPCTPWQIGSLLEWLIARNIALFIWHTEVDWSSLREILKAYPELTLVLETQREKILYHTRPLFTIMREYPNIIIEISNFSGCGYIEFVVREFGAERLIFGSFLPVNDPLAAIGMILDADISDTEKLKIASENIQRIMQGAAV